MDIGDGGAVGAVELDGGVGGDDVEAALSEGPSAFVVRDGGAAGLEPVEPPVGIGVVDAVAPGGRDGGHVGDEDPDPQRIPEFLHRQEYT